MSRTSDTLYIRHLPDDLTLADVSTHFCNAAGFLSARLRRSRASGLEAGFSICAFVEFASARDASDARDAFQGSEIRDARGVAAQLNIEFTRDGRTGRHDSRDGPGGSDYVASAQSEAHKARLPAAHMLDATRNTAGGSFGTANASRRSLPEGSSRALFVGNLPANITERELAHVFRPFPGYESLRLARTGDRIIGFATFDSDVAATIAMWSLQGYKLDLRSVGDSRLRIEYSKPRARRQDRSDRDQDDAGFAEEDFY